MHLVKAAMIDELSYFNTHVWQLEDAKIAAQDAEAKSVRTRWVLCNKGDDEAPDVRARLVACEVNDGKDGGGALYASTPPLECKRMLFSDFATRKSGKTNKPLKISVVDIRKAYFNGIPKRKIDLHFPKELGIEKGLVGLMVRCAYGTRDAGAIWEDTYTAALIGLGFVQGAASACCFYHPTRYMSVVVHGDDFTAVGEDADLTWYESGMAKSFELKIRGGWATTRATVRRCESSIAFSGSMMLVLSTRLTPDTWKFWFSLWVYLLQVRYVLLE